MIYIFLAPGFEECEALVPLDLLRRAGLRAKTVGVTQREITGAHGITVQCDITCGEAVTEGLEMVVLPGGMPGARNLEQNQTVQAYIDCAFQRGLYVGAICAAPSILGHRGLLKGRRAVCFPGFEAELEGAQVTQADVERDGKLVTARGMGVALEFGLALVQCLKGEAEAARIAAEVQRR